MVTHIRTIFTADFQRLSWAVFLFFLGMHFLAPVLPVYFQGQGFEGTELGVLLGTFLLVSLLLRPWVGQVSDAVSPKPLMMTGVVLAAIAPLGYWLLGDWPLAMWLVRLIHGASFGLFYTAATSYLVQTVPPAYKAEAISYYSNAVKLAMAFSPGLALVIMANYGADAAFQATALVTVVALLVVLPLPFLPTLAADKRQSLPTQAAVVDVAAQPDKKRFLGWLSLHKGSLPLSSIMLTQSAVFGALIPFIPMVATEKDLSFSGWFYAVYALSLISTRFVTGSWSDRLGRYVVLVPSMALVTVSVAMLAWAPNDLWFLLATAFYGLAAGAVQPSIMALISERASAREQGTAMATFAVFCDIGIATGNVVMATLGHVATYGWGLLAISMLTSVGCLAMIIEGIVNDETVKTQADGLAQRVPPSIRLPFQKMMRLMAPKPRLHKCR
jgi:MFS family permease